VPRPDVLERLLTAPGPPGCESALAAVFARATRAFSLDVSIEVGPAISTCEDLHEPCLDRLSGHSALTAGFRLEPSTGLAVTSLVTATTPATLF
jgi:hypothetical protein